MPLSPLNLSTVTIDRNASDEPIIIKKGSYGEVIRGRVKNTDGTTTELALKLLLDSNRNTIGTYYPSDIEISVNEGEALCSVTKRHYDHLEQCPKRLKLGPCQEGTHHIVKGYKSFIFKKIEDIQGCWNISKFFEGQSLNEIVRNGRKDPSTALSLEEILEIIEQITLAAKSFSDENLVHRDLSLNNLMVKREKEKPIKVKVIDCGTTRPKYFSRKNTNDCFITFDIRHPKNDILCPHGEEADLWAIGCTLFYMLSDHILYYFDDHGYDENKNAIKGDRSDPKVNPRIKFLGIMELINGPMPQEWIESGDEHQVRDYYRLERDGKYRFKFDLSGNYRTKRIDIHDPIYKTGQKKGFPPEIIERLAYLTDALLSYRQPTFDDVLMRIRKEKEQLMIVKMAMR